MGPASTAVDIDSHLIIVKRVQCLQDLSFAFSHTFRVGSTHIGNHHNEERKKGYGTKSFRIWFEGGSRGVREYGSRWPGLLAIQPDVRLGEGGRSTDSLAIQPYIESTPVFENVMGLSLTRHAPETLELD